MRFSIGIPSGGRLPNDLIFTYSRKSNHKFVWNAFEHPRDGTMGQIQRTPRGTYFIKMAARYCVPYPIIVEIETFFRFQIQTL